MNVVRADQGNHGRWLLMTRQRAFTLIELLIALTLISIIVILLFSAMRMGNRAWERVEAHAEAASEKQLVWRFLDLQIGQAKSVYQVSAKGRQVLFFGREDAVEYVSPSPQDRGGGGFFLNRLHVERRSTGQQLLLTRWLYHPGVMVGNDKVPEWESILDGGGQIGEVDPTLRAIFNQTLLVDNLKTLEISYFGVREGQPEGDWSDTWDERMGLPSLVRIKIVDKQGTWPQMVFTLAGGR